MYKGNKGINQLIMLASIITALSSSAAHGGVCTNDEISEIKTSSTVLASDVQAASSGENQTLSNFNVTNSSGTTLVTAHIASSYSPMWINCEDIKSMAEASSKKGINANNVTGASIWNYLGIDISSSLPKGADTLPAYGKVALLNRYGGLINLYFSLAGRNFANRSLQSLDGSGKNKNPRLNTIDRLYFSTQTPNQLVGYVTQGIGFRAVKTALVGNGQAGMGTMYLGIGFDGPLLASIDRSPSDPSSGWMSMELYGAYNHVTAGTLSTLFGAPTTDTNFPTSGVRLTIGLPGKFSLNVDYSKAWGNYARKNIGDVFMFTVGYDT